MKLCQMIWRVRWPFLKLRGVFLMPWECVLQRLLTDQHPRLRQALRYTIYGKLGVFDADRFIDVMEAFETFTAAARTGGGSEMQGSMASLGSVTALTSTTPALWALQQPPRQIQNQIQRPSVQQPGHTRTALLFIFSEQGGFFREFILDEVKFPPFSCLKKDRLGNAPHLF